MNGGNDNGNGHNNEDEGAIVAAFPSSMDVRRIAQTLEDSVLFRIAEFLNPIESAVVYKLWFKAATKTSESALSRITNKHCVDSEWRLRLAQHTLDCYKRFYFGGGGGGSVDTTTATSSSSPNHQHPTRPQFNPTLHPRLLWQCRDKRPLANLITPHMGPSVVLPNGNIAMACADNAIRILDTQKLTWTVAGHLDTERVPFPYTEAITERLAVLISQERNVETVADVLREGGTGLLGQLLQRHNAFCWVTDRLFYSGGHLVLHHDSSFGSFVHCNWVHVWKLEGEGDNVSAQHLYSKDLKGNCPNSTQDVDQVAAAASPPPPPQDGETAAPPPSLEGLVVAANGRMYSLWSFGEGRVDQVATHEVASGNCLAIQPMQMRTRSDIVSSLMVSGNHLLQFRWIEKTGPFPADIGLGIYSYDMMDDRLALTQFLPRFGGGEMHLDCDRSLRIHKWILYNMIGEPFSRMISINESGILEERGRLTFGGRDYVMLATANRVFVEDPDERGGTIKLDEYDVATGTKVRTLATGIPREGHSVASVVSNGIEVFCTIGAHLGNPRNVVQSFLL